MGSILVNSDEADRSLQRTDQNVEGVGNKFLKGIGIAAKWGAAAVLAAGTAAAAIGGVALKAAVDYEKQMANVATLLDGDVKTKINNMGAAVKKLSSDTGTSTELLTDGLYQVVSAFGETDDAMKILEISTKGAAAGNATVTDSVNLLSAVTKGYGDTSAKAAQKTSDLAFLTVKLGQTTFPELASSMGKVIPLAGAMKVKQEELFGAMATLTGVTGATSEVTTQLRGAIQGFMKPSESMSAALKGMGFETGAAALESLGLEGALQGLKKSVNGNDTALAGMFGSVEAGTAVLALTGTQAENFAAKTLQMKNAAGATEAAFKTQQATVSAMMEKMKASFDVVMITLGEKLLPVFNDLLKWVIDNMPQIQSVIDKAMQVVSDVFTTVSNIVKDVLIPLFKSIWEWASPFMPKIKSAFETAFSAIKDAIQKAYDYIEPSFNRLVKTIRDSLMPIITGLWDTVKKAMPGVKAVFESTMPLVVAAVKLAIDIVNLIIKTVKGIYDFIKPSLDKVATLFSTVFSGISKVIDGVQWVLDKFNGTSIKNKTSTVTTRYIDEHGGSIGQNASGTDNWKGGLTWVGEKGPELIDLRKGAKVYDNNKSMDIATNNSTVAINKQPISIQLVLQNGKTIAEFLVDDLDNLMGNKNKITGRSVGF